MRTLSKMSNELIFVVMPVDSANFFLCVQFSQSSTVSVQAPFSLSLVCVHQLYIHMHTQSVIQSRFFYKQVQSEIRQILFRFLVSRKNRKVTSMCP